MPEGTTFPEPIRLLPRSGAGPDDRQSSDPFIRLSADAHPLRAYLAQLALDDRPIVDRLAILMQPNEYPGSLAAGTRAPIGNGQWDRIWRQGLLRHRQLKAPAIAALERRALRPGSPEGEVPLHTPLAWCRKTGAYITPLCPACLGIMRTCRDEALLRRGGLSPYESSLVRFLHCPACAAQGKRQPVFYTYSLRKLDGLAKTVQLRRRSELYRDLGPRISSGQDRTDSGSPPANPEAKGGVAALHACFRCEHRASCYPAGRHVDDRLPAEELLFPLAYYDFHWLPLEPLPLSYHETAALLGGALPADLAGTETPVTGGPSPRDEALTELARPGSQFFFEGDATGLFPLEALYLKLSAVADLARAAHDLLAETGFAHLALTPDRLRGHLATGPAILPVRWSLTLKIGDLLTTAPPGELEADRTDDEPLVGSLPQPCLEAFVPEEMCRPQIENLWMRLAVEELQAEESGQTRRARIRARLTAPDLYRGAEHGDHDLVRVVLVLGPAGGQRIVFSGRKAAAVPGGFLFAGLSGPLPETVGASFGPADLPASSNAEVTLVHAFAAPADIVSLGLLLLRLLLTNDGQDTSRLDARLTSALAEAVAGDPGVTDIGERSRLRAAFAAEGLSCRPAEVLFRQIDREAAQVPIPAGLWEDALQLALRMASNLRGWSICAGQDDYDPDDPARPLEVVIQELEELTERARGSLIGSAGRNGTVQEVCDDFLADLAEAARAGARRAADESFDKTMVSPPESMSP
jgi:hypothetical protein